MTCPSTALPRRAFSLAVALVLLTGCALSARQKAAVGQFSESATTLGDVTSSQLKAMRDGTVEMTKQRLLLAGKSRDPNLGDQTSLDRGFEVSRVETVSGAARAKTKSQRTRLTGQQAQIAGQLQVFIDKTVDEALSEYRAASSALSAANAEAEKAKRDLDRVAATIKKFAAAIDQLAALAAKVAAA